MPELEIMLAFSVIAFMAILMPGPDIIYISAQSSFYGFRHGLAASIGVATGALFHIILAAAGLTAIFATSEIAFEVVRWAGVVYLLYMAYGIITSKTEEVKDRKPRTTKYIGVFIKGILTNILNPKAVLFFMALFPQFVDYKSSVAVSSQISVLGIELVVIALITFSALSYIISVTRSRFVANKNIQRIQKWFFGGTLGSAALFLALNDKK